MRRRPRPAPLILASASPQRKKLLSRLGLPFKIIPSHVSEHCSQKNPRRLVLELARRKAASVARRHPKARVLGADTIVVCRGKILGKPRDHKHSGEILRLLSGRWQRVYTGVALAVEGGRRIATEAVVTKVLARKLDGKALEAMTGKHMDKAGAYAVQDRGDPFIERIVGERDNVVGLPLKAVRRLLRRAQRHAERLEPKTGRESF